jgi:hypothetical protein
MTTYQWENVWNKITLLFAHIKLLHKILQTQVQLEPIIAVSLSFTGTQWFQKCCILLLQYTW